MYGLKVDYEKKTIEIKPDMQGTEEGYTFYETKEEVDVHARNAQYVFSRWEWNALDDYDSPRAIELEKLLWGREFDFVPGEHRKRAKKRREER